MKSCDHEFVDRIVRIGGWYNLAKLVIYCKRCGRVSTEKYL